MPPFFPRRILMAFVLAISVTSVRAQVESAVASEGESGRTIIVSAEGLADPDADTYQKDQGLLLDALRADARKQVIEKAVGTFVESSTLTENYMLINDRILTQSAGLIKQVIKESEPWKGEDGFMHLLLKAEVYIDEIGDVLREMSKTERVSLIKEYGNPKISVAVTVRDADREGDGNVERSQVAENVLIESLTRFGYRVWSLDPGVGLPGLAGETGADKSSTGARGLNSADFAILGEAKFKKLTATLSGGTTVTKYALTSLTLRCTNNNTGEMVAPNTEVPKKKTWADEDGALEEVGQIIMSQFNEQFFQEQLMVPSRIYQLVVSGLPSYDTGTLLKKEMIGLRPVLNVEFRSFDAEGLSNFEVEYAGGRENIAETLNLAVVKPLNQKFQGELFALTGAHGDVVKLAFTPAESLEGTIKAFDVRPPASLANASPERLAEIAKSERAMKAVASVNPEAVAKLAASGSPVASSAAKAAADF